MPLTTISEGQEAFRTHHNYIRSLKRHIEGSTLSYTGVSAIVRAPVPFLNSKTNLIDLTILSLKDEAEIVSKDKDYSYASTSWLPIKTYYLLFNMMLTIEYLFAPERERESFKITHNKCAQNFTKRLACGEIKFSNLKLNEIYNRDIFCYREQSGANLRSASGFDHTRLALKKIAQYKQEEWQRQKRIPDFIKPEHRRKKEEFRRGFQLSVFEFPYHMRLRANYRDFAFIEGVSSADTARYFNDYFVFAIGFYKALLSLKSQLEEARAGH